MKVKCRSPDLRNLETNKQISNSKEITTMIKRYEDACVMAGLSEEQTAAIRRIFDADYKRLDRRKKAQERNNVVIMSVTTMVADFEEVGDYEIPDDTYNPEVLILHEIELAELREHLSELDDEDRQFLLDCFDSQIGCAAAGEAIGLTKNQAHYKKVKLLEELRKKMK